MFDELNRLAGWNLQNLPEESILVSDVDGADSSFLLHHFISAYLKSNRHVIMVGLAQTFSHYAVCCSKISSINLQKSRDCGNFTFIDNLTDNSEEYLFGKESQQAAKYLFSKIQDQIEDCSKKLEGAAVIIDDLTSLFCVGCPVMEIWKLVKHLSALCQAHNIIIIALIHQDIENEDFDFSIHDLCQNFFNIEVNLKGLKSGHSKDVNGHLQIIKKQISSHGRTIYNHLPLQHYRLSDRKLQLFAPGTSNAVL